MIHTVSSRLSPADAARIKADDVEVSHIRWLESRMGFSIDDGPDILASQEREPSSWTSWATWVEQNRTSITLVVDRNLGGKFRNGNADSFIRVCAIIIVERYAQLCTFKVIIAFVEIQRLRRIDLFNRELELRFTLLIPWSKVKRAVPAAADEFKCEKDSEFYHQ